MNKPFSFVMSCLDDSVKDDLLMGKYDEWKLSMGAYVATKIMEEWFNDHNSDNYKKRFFNTWHAIEAYHAKQRKSCDNLLAVLQQAQSEINAKKGQTK